MMKLIALNEKSRRIGQDHHNAKYSDSEVELVLSLHSSGWGYKRIAAKMEMPIRTVRSFCSGKCRCQCVAIFKQIRV